MRISDWSSDVCSSDLLDHGDRACDVLLRADRPVHLPVLEPAGLKPWTRRFLQRWLITGFFAVALVILLGNRWVINSTDAYIYKDWALMPDNEVGVVPGTSKYLENEIGRASCRARGWQNG